jgi:hypothetical protein
MVQRHDLSARHSGVLQRRQSSTTPNNSAGDCSSSTPTAQRPTLPTQRSLYTTDAEVFVMTMQHCLAASCRGLDHTSIALGEA